MKTVVFGNRVFEPELIIFDKDGTLTDFRKTWLPILNRRIEIIGEQINASVSHQELKELIYRTFGIQGDRIDPYGPFPYTPRWEDEIIFATALYSIGVPWQKGKTVARYSLHRVEEEIDRRDHTELFEGVAEVLAELKRCGILLSLATADLTDIAVKVLKHTKIYDLFDYVIGADMVQNDKPDPEMVLNTLSALQVEAPEAALVGDSITDMEMGRRAGLGLVVGVTEGGVAASQDLAHDADVVISSVRDIRVIS